MTIDARIPLMGVHIDMADIMAKSEAYRANRSRRRMAEQEFEQANERRSSLADYMLTQRGGPQGGASGGVPQGGGAGGFGGGGRLSDLMRQPSSDPAATAPPGSLGQFVQQGQPQLPGQAQSMPQAAGDAPAPMSRERMAYERAVRADPDAFLTFEGKRLDIGAKQLEAFRDLNDTAMQLLGGVNSQETYDAALRRAHGLYAQHGMDLSEMGLPAQYSPEVVESLRMQGMSTDKQLQAVARENKLDWDMWDDTEDNERADRTADSMDEHRDGMRANVARGQTLTDQRGRRGQDLSHQDRVRGQDMTDKRTRGSASYQGRGGRGGGGSSTRDGAIIVNPATGERKMLQGGKWVPVK